jgi:hypothetical protein
MKSKFTLVAALMVAFIALKAQQIPNGGFENWTVSYKPDNWATVDGLFGSPLGFTTKDTADKVEGSVSIKLTSDSLSLAPQAGVVPGLVSLGSATYSPTTGPQFFGIPFTYRPDTLFFSYKYSTPGADTAGVQLILSKSGSQPVLAGGVPLGTTNGQWANVYVPLTGSYSGPGTPDTLLLQFYASFGDVAIKGSTLNVDGVRFGYTTNPCTAPTAPTSATASATTITQGQNTILSVNGGNVGNGQWVWYTGSCGGTQIGTGPSLTVTPNATTTFYVRGEGCGSNTNCVQVTITVNPVGINDVTEVELNVFPNPASDVINITSAKNLAGYNFQVLDVTGRVISTTTLTGETTSVFVADLAKGNYIYKITDKNNGLVKQSKFSIVK